ncbi:hypothetical protein GCM10022206_75580 [Streptomyces chiangmaiensis]
MLSFTAEYFQVTPARLGLQPAAWAVVPVPSSRSTRRLRRVDHRDLSPRSAGYRAAFTVFIVKCEVTFLIRGIVMTRRLRKAS